MSPTDRSAHFRPQDQVLVRIAPGPRPRPTSSIPLPSFPSVNTVKSAQGHDAVATNRPHKEDPLVDRDSKLHSHQLYHIDSDPNVSTNQLQAQQAPSFKDATMIDMTEYPLDRNEDKEEDDTRSSKGESQLAHYGQHHPLKSHPHSLASNKVDRGSHKVDDASVREPPEQQDDSTSLQEQATNPSPMQYSHPSTLSVPESTVAATVGGENDSVSVQGQQQNNVLYPRESDAQSESTTSDTTRESRPEVEHTAGDQHNQLHTTTSTTALSNPPSAAITTFSSQGGGSTTAPAASAAAVIAAVSIMVTGVDTKPQRQQQQLQQQQRPQQPHASSLFDFFRGRKTSIPKSSSNNLPHPPPSATKGSPSSGSAIPTMSSAVPVRGPLTGTPPPISKSRIFSSATKTSLDSGYPRRGSIHSSNITTPTTTYTNRNTSIYSSNIKPSNPINKRETIGSLPMPTRIDRGMGAPSNRASYAFSNSTSTAIAHSSHSSSGGPFATADSVPRKDTAVGAKTGTSASRQVSAVSATPITSTTTTTTAIPTPTPAQPSTHTGTTVSSHSIASSAQSTLTKVAAAVVGATVGKRRPMVANDLSNSSSSIGGETDLGQTSNSLGLAAGGGAVKALQQPLQQPLSLQRQRHSMTTTMTTTTTTVHGLAKSPLKNNLVNEESTRQRLVGLDQERLGQHATFMKAERSLPELREYISQLYKTILGKDEAFEYSQKQLSLLQSELDRVRSHAEEEKKELVDEMDRTKEQIVTMEENFLLWRTKVHNDQATLQDNLLNERLDKQDRIDELEEDLNASQEEADRLRNRLLVLEYEEGYHGPSSFLPDDSASDVSSSPGRSSRRGSSVTIAMEHGPMTVDIHRRRSADFSVLEQRAQSFEALVQDLRRTLELERQQHQTDLKTFRMQSQARFDKLEHDLQAAKMEATMYAEMMHEVVTENDDLRSRVKSARRVMRRHGWTDPNKKNSGDSSSSGGGGGGGKNSSVVVSASTSRSNSQSSASDRRRHRSRARNSDHFGFPGEMDYSDNESDDGSEDGMEEIAI